jgi:DNA helicase-2/ATP-dependent DNA helicase PcrA
MTRKYVLHGAAPGHELKINYEAELNREQLEVVRGADGKSLVLAGAGSGKTRTLIYRVLYLLEQGVKPDQILLVTFTNKAAGEMRGRMEKHLGGSMQGLWCGTFHHIGNRILRQHAAAMGLSPGFGILDEEDSRTLIKACYAALPFKPTDLRFPQASVVRGALSFAANTQKTLRQILDERYPYFSHLEDGFRAIAADYERRKRESNNLDFDDLLLTWVRLLREHPEVGGHLSEQFRYCLVDEYQDINPLQNTVMELLSKRHGNLLVVGDDAQSIYSFRGAEVQNILDFPKRHEQVKIFKLQTNYRSTPEILALANGSIRNNLRQFTKDLVSVRDSQKLPELIKVRDLRDQSTFVAQRILELIDEGVELKQIAVLFRARYQAAELEMELSRRQIPYVLRGGVRFFEQAHIKDVLAYLKILENPKDAVAWSRALTLYPGIGPGIAEKLHAEYLGLFDGSDLVAGQARLVSAAFGAKANKRARAGIEDFKNVIRKISDPKDAAHPDLLIQKILDAGYSREVLARFDNAKDRIEDLKELANFAHTYKSLSSFLTDLALKENFRGESFAGQDDGKAKPEPDDQLILSTIHQAKGLEWKVVFVLGLADGQFPHHQSKSDERALEEERRLFYVAVTRSQDELYLIHPMTRYDREAGLVISRPSPFVEELPSHVYEGVEAMEEEAPRPSWKRDSQERDADDDEIISIDEF